MLERLMRNWRYTFLLALILAAGFTLRYTFWANPGFGATFALIYDVETYTVFGIQYIESLASLNFTALSHINPGVPPLGMILTGTAATLLGPHIGYIQAGLLAPLTASSLTPVAVYLAVERRSRKSALIASALVTLDPYQIQFSAAYLDCIGTFFTVTSVYFLVKGRGRRDLVAATIFAVLAALTKLTYLLFPLIFAALLIIQHRIPMKAAAVYAITPIASMVLNPWLWTPSTLNTAVQGSMAFNNLPLSPLLGPFAIGVPQSLPWYILTYLGLGSVSWSTLPQVTPLVLLALLIWSALSRRTAPPCLELTAAAAMIATIFLLPRNYWTYVWAGSVRGEDVLFKQFYPYYFYPIGPFLSILVGALLAQQNGRSRIECPRLVSYPVLLTALLSPFAFVMNLAFPYWDFIFTLIYNYSQGQWLLEGAAMIAFTTALTAVLVLLAEYLYRRATNTRPPAPTLDPTRADRTNC